MAFCQAIYTLTTASQVKTHTHTTQRHTEAQDRMGGSLKGCVCVCVCLPYKSEVPIKLATTTQIEASASYLEDYTIPSCIGNSLPN